MDVDAYLRRIGYDGPRDASAGALRSLHRVHMLAVPFENLDIHLGRPIALDQAALFEKIVGRRRGGFCYELNGLFAALLRELGFGVTLLAAAVARGDGQFGPEFDHMALLVEAPGQTPERWLADVGFGDSFRAPLPLLERIEQRQEDGQVYRLERDGERWTMLGRAGAGWQAQYRFTLQPHDYAEYAEMCRYHQTSPESSFTRKRVCSLATPGGRITLSDLTLIVTERGERTERLLAGEQEHRATLRELFGIDF